MSGDEGSYRFENVPAGPAQLTFKLINFASVRRDITVVAGGTVTVDVTLSVAYGADITITAPLTFRNLAAILR